MDESFSLLLPVVGPIYLLPACRARHCLLRLLRGMGNHSRQIVCVPRLEEQKRLRSEIILDSCSARRHHGLTQGQILENTGGLRFDAFSLSLLGELPAPRSSTCKRALALRTVPIKWMALTVPA